MVHMKNHILFFGSHYLRGPSPYASFHVTVLSLIIIMIIIIALTQSTWKLGLGKAFGKRPFTKKIEVGTLKRQKDSSLSNLEQPCVENLSVLINNSSSLMSTFNFTHTWHISDHFGIMESCSLSIWHVHLVSSIHHCGCWNGRLNQGLGCEARMCLGF